MSTLGEIFSQEAGQRRRAWLDAQTNRALDAAQYYLGPGVPVRAFAEGANALNPVADLQQMSQATTRAMQPGRTGGERLGDILEAGTSAASFLAPGVGAAVAQRMAASRGGSLAGDVGQGANALADTLAGMRAAPERALRDFIADDAGAIGRGAETPAQEVARFLREGRASEVTNEMYLRADPLELHDLYIRGATGADMPMDEASRMARARELYERAASTSRIQGRVPGLRTVDAPNFIATQSRSWSDGVRTSRTLAGTSATSMRDTERAARMHRLGPNTRHNEGYYPGDVTGVIAGERVRSGRDPGEVILRNPEAVFVRSRSARFDPRLSHLSHLSAGAAGAGVTLGALTQQPPQQDPRREIAEYLQSIR